MENKLYPLKFGPILKDKIWGGDRLRKVLNKTGASDMCGESWEISGVPGDISVVSNGWLAGNTLAEIQEIYMGDLVGEKLYERFGNMFPLLIKFIDAQQDLSIQVHPNDEMALERHKSYGKTEMWYIVDAEKNTRLMMGFQKEMAKEDYLAYMEKGEIEQIANYEQIAPGDVYFIPAGRVHAICAGTLLAEIQQTSDVTYRIYDYKRKDTNGLERELHTELAIDAIDFSCPDKCKTEYEILDNGTSSLVSCNYFITNLIFCNQAVNKDYHFLDSFVIYICVEGEAKVVYDGGEILMQKGETLLVPADVKELKLLPLCPSKILEVYLA
jgi:mannose-6-phosphate isomerase